MGNRSGTKTRSELDVAAVRAKAHELWLQRGCPEGESEEHWYEAERLLGTDKPPDSAPPSSKSPDSATPPSSGRRQRSSKAAPARARARKR
jgi:hypothetical protein